MTTTSGRTCPQCFQERFNGIKCENCEFTEGTEKKIPKLPRFYVLKERYILGRVLGAGGFGITYVALDRITKQRVAIKEFFPESIVRRAGDGRTVEPHPDRVYDYEIGKEKFYNEATLVKSMEDIDEIVNVYAAFEENETVYMVMEYVEGPSFRQVCKETKGSVSWPEARNVLISLLNTLDQVHIRKALHRDVAPDNIIFRKTDGEAILIDFGASRHVQGYSDHLTRIFKPGFAAPEQYQSKGVQGPWTDIYGLGCSIYWYLTGQKVPEYPDRVNGKEMEPISSFRSDVPEAFSETIFPKMVELNYKRRYQNIGQVFEDMVTYKLIDIEKPTEVSPPEPEKSVSRQGTIDKSSSPQKSLWRRILDFLFGKSDKEEQNIVQFPRDDPREILSESSVHISHNYWSLVGVGDVVGGQQYSFSCDKIVIGRKETCDVVLKNARVVSGSHCDIVRRNDSFELTDHSTNGTFLLTENGKEKIEGKVFLKENQKFYLASADYTFKIIIQ